MKPEVSLQRGKTACPGTAAASQQPSAYRSLRTSWRGKSRTCKSEGER